MYVELTDTEIEILNQLLKYFPDYGGFEVQGLGFTLCYHPHTDKQKEEFKWINDYYSDKVNHSNRWCFKNIQSFLLHNGYCKVDPIKTQEHFENVELTAKGRELKEVGNYYEFLKNLTSDSARIRALEIEGSRMARRQYNINVWIAIGTCVAGTWSLNDILKNYYPSIHPCFRDFVLPYGILLVLLLLLYSVLKSRLRQRNKNE